MDTVALILISVGLAMDAFAVSICKGLAMKDPDQRSIVIIALWFFFMRRMNSSMGMDKTMGFGKAKIKKADPKKKTTFADVAGQDEAK